MLHKKDPYKSLKISLGDLQKLSTYGKREEDVFHFDILNLNKFLYGCTIINTNEPY